MESQDNKIIRHKFNPVDSFYKSVVGGVKINEPVVFTVISNANKISIKVREDWGESTVLAMKKAGNQFSATYCPKKSGLFWYSFSIDGKYFGMPAQGYFDERFEYLSEHGGEYQLTIYSEDYTTPDWFKGGVIYQIFPDRYFRLGDTQPRPCQKLRLDWGGQPEYKPVKGKVLNNDFFGGTFKGITEKLPYIKSLGVTTIYLNPIFEARSNHRYDTGDYMKVDGLLGEESHLQELFQEAEKLGIKVVLDGVFNHTGDDSIYFNKYRTYGKKGAYNAKESQYFDWFCFKDYPKQYDSWWGIDILPTTNKSSKSFRRFICGKNGVVRKYLSLGASGWRLDVVDELPSDFVEEIRACAKKEKPEAVVIGEVWENVTDKIAYGVRRKYFQGRELDSAMNYPLKNAIINFLVTSNSRELISVIRRQVDNYPKQSLDCIMNLLGTHDTPRIINVLSGVEYPNGREKQAISKLTEEEYRLGIKRLKIALAMEYTLYGSPTIYYGDEVGMCGWADPFNRGCMDWEKVSELTEYYKALGQIRSKSQVFARGSVNIEVIKKSFIVYSREDEEQKIYTAVNLGECPVGITFTGQAENILVGDKAKYHQLQPCSVGIFKEIK